MPCRRVARTLVLSLGIALFAVGGPGVASELETPKRMDILKETQNPLTRVLASVTLENEFAFGLGSENEFGYSLWVKPSVPMILSDRWSLINRILLPLFDQPSQTPGGSKTFGLGDIQYALLLSPTTARRILWGAGPVVQFPSATNDLLGTGKWLLGPAAAFVVTSRRTVLGVIAQNLWSVAGDSKRADVKRLLLRPLLNVNLPRDWFIAAKPNITANWEAEKSQRWTVSLGGGFGKVFRVGNFGISLETQFFGYPVKPDGGPQWSARLDLKMLFHRGYLRGDRRTSRPHRQQPQISDARRSEDRRRASSKRNVSLRSPQS